MTEEYLVLKNGSKNVWSLYSDSKNQIMKTLIFILGHTLFCMWAIVIEFWGERFHTDVIETVMKLLYDFPLLNYQVHQSTHHNAKSNQRDNESNFGEDCCTHDKDKDTQRKAQSLLYFQSSKVIYKRTKLWI